MQKELTIEEIQDFKGKYPKQIWPLFFSEMWERFSFYGMRGMLVFFMINHLNFNEVVANLQYGATQAFVYAFTFVGGLFADKILGKRRSLFWGGILMIVGSILLAINPSDFFFLGIAFNVVVLYASSESPIKKAIVVAASIPNSCLLNKTWCCSKKIG